MSIAPVNTGIAQSIWNRAALTAVAPHGDCCQGRLARHQRSRKKNRNPRSKIRRPLL